MVAKKNNLRDINRRLQHYALVNNADYIKKDRERISSHIKRYEVELVKYLVYMLSYSGTLGGYSLFLIASLEYDVSKKWSHKWQAVEEHLSYYYFAIRLSALLPSAGTITWDYDFKQLAHLLAAAIAFGDDEVADFSAAVMADCIAGRKPLFDDSMEDRIYEPGILKLYHVLRGSEPEGRLPGFDCGIYDRAIATRDDPAAFRAAFADLTDYHFAHYDDRETRYEEFCTSPCDLLPFELWAFAKLNPAAAPSSPIMEWSNPPATLQIAGYPDPILDQVRDIWFSGKKVRFPWDPDVIEEERLRQIAIAESKSNVVVKLLRKIKRGLFG